jgi:molybdenum cofactor cytidylyltransferase
MIVGILLAAGASTRFGSNKLLHPLLCGTPIAVAAARSLKQSVDRTIAVVRTQADELSQLLRAESFEIVVCPNASEGMGHSLACGVAAANEASGWLIALADMPYMKPETTRAVIRRLENGAVIAAPSFEGQRGHPVGFNGSLYEELLALGGDSGARGLLVRHQHQVEIVTCDDQGIVRDVNIPADLCAPAVAPTGAAL